MIGAACSAREADELGPNCRPAGAEDRGHIYGAARLSSDAGAHTEEARICAEIAGAFVPLQAKVFGDWLSQHRCPLHAAHGRVGAPGQRRGGARSAAQYDRARPRPVARRRERRARRMPDRAVPHARQIRGGSAPRPRQGRAAAGARAKEKRRLRAAGGGGRCIECRCTHASCRRQGKSGAPI